MIPKIIKKEIDKMAKASKVVTGDGIDKAFLAQLVSVMGTDTVLYVGQVQGQPMLAHSPPLIEINITLTDPNDGSKVACRATPAAKDYLSAHAAPQTSGEKVSNYEIISNAVLPPPKKRGNTSGSGAPTKYPFADLVVGGSFFSANTEHKTGDAVKALGSTVSAQNDKYAEPTGEMKTVTRAVRDKQTKKAMLDEAGNKITETVQLPIKKYNRKFSIRPVIAGETYGGWTAPADGALIGRIV
jgi:hypothetical protein